jgi:hypothetical protein
MVSRSRQTGWVIGRAAQGGRGRRAVLLHHRLRLHLFVLYFGIARRRGYTTASYILALTPLLAVTISTLFEGKKWNVPLNQRRASVTGSRIRWIRRTPPKRFA